MHLLKQNALFENCRDSANREIGLFNLPLAIFCDLQPAGTFNSPPRDGLLGSLFFRMQTPGITCASRLQTLFLNFTRPEWRKVRYERTWDFPARRGEESRDSEKFIFHGLICKSCAHLGISLRNI